MDVLGINYILTVYRTMRLGKLEYFTHLNSSAIISRELQRALREGVQNGKGFTPMPGFADLEGSQKNPRSSQNIES